MIKALIIAFIPILSFAQSRLPQPGYYLIGYAYADSTNRFVGYGNFYKENDTLGSHNGLIKTVKQIKPDAFRIVITSVYKFRDKAEYFYFIPSRNILKP